jgi:hypothetical protein
MAATPPVCHIPPVTQTTQPGPQALPNIPPAQPTIASLTATVNALRQLVMILAGQQGPQGPNGAQGKAAPAGSWKQKSISTSKVKVYQNNDPSTGVFVEVQRIDNLVMGNSDTNQTWTFQRPPDASGS